MIPPFWKHRVGDIKTDRQTAGKLTHIEIAS